MRAEGYAVESILRVLRQQGLSIAARTYRAWKHPARVADRTVTDALVEDKIRELAWTFNATTQRWQMTPEGLYGRRKWVALLRRQEGLAGTSRGAVDRAIRTLGVAGHDVVVTGVGMKERVPDRHDGWCLSNRRPGGDPFHDPP